MIDEQLLDNSNVRNLDIGDELILAETGKRAKFEDFNHQYNVIFVHGFTSHGNYMQSLTADFDNNSFRSFLFNYNSYRGIQEAARVLLELLDDLDSLGDGVLSARKIAFVCHSMGGLVVRAFSFLPNAANYVTNIVTLGTPHNGTLKNSDWLKCIVKWGENVSNAMPGFTKKSCQSAKEILGIDEDVEENQLLSLLKRKNPAISGVPVLSVSGAKSWLEFAKNPVVNMYYNNKVQSLLGDEENDGLVPEQSSNLLYLECDGCVPKFEHLREYAEFYNINHTFLTHNQNLALKVMRWVRETHSNSIIVSKVTTESIDSERSAKPPH